MLELVSAFIQAERLIAPEDRVLVGVSGGADSTFMLHVLVRLGYRCVAAYLDHGQRQGAAMERELCRGMAEALDVPFIFGSADVPKLADDAKIGLEEAGREARYEFFEKAARGMGCSRIATAHTLDDQVETILFNLVRGSGLGGLRGIPIRRDRIIRPILCVRKADAEAYCVAHGLPTSHDPSNDDLQFSRARIRHRVIPELVLINASAVASINRVSRLVAEEDEFLNSMAAAALEQAEIVGHPQLAFLTRHLEVALSQSRMSALPPVLFRRGMLLACKVLGAKLDSRHLESIVGGVKAGLRGCITSPEGLATVEWREDQIVLKSIQPADPFSFPLEIPERIEHLDFGWVVTVKFDASTGDKPRRDALEAELTLSGIQRPLSIRNFRAGDRMRPFGFDRHRKLSDLAGEARVSEMGRKRLPVLCDLLGPVWAPGVCLDQRAVAMRSQEPIIRVSFQALELLKP